MMAKQRVKRVPAEFNLYSLIYILLYILYINAPIILIYKVFLYFDFINIEINLGFGKSTKLSI